MTIHSAFHLKYWLLTFGSMNFSYFSPTFCLSILKFKAIEMTQECIH